MYTQQLIAELITAHDVLIFGETDHNCPLIHKWLKDPKFWVTLIEHKGAYFCMDVPVCWQKDIDAFSAASMSEQSLRAKIFNENASFKARGLCSIQENILSHDLDLAISAVDAGLKPVFMDYYFTDGPADPLNSPVLSLIHRRKSQGI